MKIRFLVLTLMSLTYGTDASAEGKRRPAAHQNNDCTQAWNVADYRIVPYLDLNAQYLNYQFVIPKGQRISLRFQGDFPTARYMSYQLYEQETENPISEASDIEVRPDDGNVNPFLPGTDRYSEKRKYTVWARCSKSGKSPAGIALPCSDEDDSVLDLWYRVYASDKKGPLTPPKITAYDAVTGKPIACPPLAPKEFSIATRYNLLAGKRLVRKENRDRVPLPLKEGGRIEFYIPKSDGVGANANIVYATSRLDGRARWFGEKLVLQSMGVYREIGDVTLLKFRMPTFPNTKARIPSYTGQEDVRYWSLCVSGETTEVSDCLMDADAKPVSGPDGSAHALVMIGPGDDAELKSAAGRMGYNYLSYGEFRGPVLIYRQMMAREGFAGSLAKVPVITKKIAAAKDEISVLAPYFASTAIGEYAPQGKQCWRDDVVAGTCKLP